MEIRLNYHDIMLAANQLEEAKSQLDGIWFDFVTAGGYGPNSRAMRIFTKRVQDVSNLRCDYLELLENDIAALKRMAYQILMNDLILGHSWRPPGGRTPSNVLRLL